VPIERISKGFKDISATFQINPMNDDLIALKNENAIARSLRNLIFTVPGEKPFQPSIGSRVSELLFESLDQITATQIKGEIDYTIRSFEPRVKLLEVVVTPDYDNNEFNCRIKYEIVGTSEVQELTFVLEPTR
tara:strand:+ start:907 stop:1305 length:399 start_codon:yes stop_codon:yes gene_type:complete